MAFSCITVFLSVQMTIVIDSDKKGNSRESRASQHSPSAHSDYWLSKMDMAYSGSPAEDRHIPSNS